MKIALISYALAAISVASAENIYFSVQDPKTGAQLATIQDRHSMAGGSFWFYGGPSFYDYDPSSKLVKTKIGPNTYQWGATEFSIGTFPGVFMNSRDQTQLTTDANGKVTTYNFFACTGINDPYRYSNNTPIVMVNAPGNTTLPRTSCTPIDIYKVKANIPGVDSITSYTTFCPSPTVITITSCGTQTCAPSTITVSAAATITCAQCIAPAGTSASAASASAASISTLVAGAAGKATFGAASLVGVVAALLL